MIRDTILRTKSRTRKITNDGVGEGLAPGARSCRDRRFTPGAGKYVNLFAIKFDISLANIEYRVLNIR